MLIKPNGPLHRVLDDKGYARDFVERGRFRLSTLEICRRHEGLRRDRDEGTEWRESGHSAARNVDRAIQSAVAAIGGTIDPDSVVDVDIDRNARVQRIPDAWVLCMTERLDSVAPAKFGRYVVEIHEPREFFRLVWHGIANRGHPIRWSEWGRVVYGPHRRRGLQPSPGPPGFVKDPDEYESEQEVRLLWQAFGVNEGDRLPPLVLEIPEVRNLCALRELDRGSVVIDHSPRGPFALPNPGLREEALRLSGEIASWRDGGSDPVVESLRQEVASMPDGAEKAERRNVLAEIERHSLRARLVEYERRFLGVAIDVRDAMLNRLPWPLPFARDGMINMHYEAAAFGGQIDDVAEDLRRLANQLIV